MLMMCAIRCLLALAGAGWLLGSSSIPSGARCGFFSDRFWRVGATESWIGTSQVSGDRRSRRVRVCVEFIAETFRAMMNILCLRSLGAALHAYFDFVSLLAEQMKNGSLWKRWFVVTSKRARCQERHFGRFRVRVQGCTQRPTGFFLWPRRVAFRGAHVWKDWPKLTTSTSHDEIALAKWTLSAITTTTTTTIPVCLLVAICVFP